ncbi:hypothetical protein NP095_11515 [Aeromicrobium duanguangcaii]|uniref:ABC transporter permease n=2 Tax=Aeromicrobium duanguangcaii TaxID=2968086 RepID=A0ABY5KFC0_9ACTN|nr:hypothetical protein [Aeromicrobium duanguangcaii]UUI67822.1 hypothetical protein NP095_11515 [Aeromicrobium duanguangcaii]
MMIGVAGWVGLTGTTDFAEVERLLPGGAATEVVVGAWDGGMPLTDSPQLLLQSVGWVVVAVVLAARFFRWEPRR